MVYDEFCHLLIEFLISRGVTAFLDAGANKVPIFPRWPCRVILLFYYHQKDVIFKPSAINVVKDSRRHRAASSSLAIPRDLGKKHRHVGN